MTDNTSTGVAADNNNNTTNGTDNTNPTSTDKTNENTKKNDPEKNKTLAEITIMESLRDIPSYTIRIPRLIRGIHTNSFFYCDVADDFYEKNYPQLVKPIANTKFARYAGFRENWFYIDKVEMEMGDEWYTEISFNPLPTSLGEYVKLRQEAEKALIQAMNSEKNAQSVGSVSATTGGGGVGTTLDATNGDGTQVGLAQISGKDCTPTIEIDTTGFNIDDTAKHIVGNSSANYAVDTANMSGKQAILDVYHRFKYTYYRNNRTCPQKMWNKTGRIYGNCGDIARLIMCVAQVHGIKAGCHFRGDHWYNLIELNGKTYRFDCCFQSRRGYTSPGYGHEMCNNLTFLGGPWSNG